MNYLDIYNTAFSNPNYNKHDITEERFQLAIKNINFDKFNSVIDVGCGRGLYLAYLKENYPHLKLYGLDINTFSEYTNLIQDITHKEWSNIPNVDFINCGDVLEHIHIDSIDNVLYNINKYSNYSFISIANHSDIHNGIELHVTQKNLDFWCPTLTKYFDIRYTNVLNQHYYFYCQSK